PTHLPAGLSNLFFALQYLERHPALFSFIKESNRRRLSWLGRTSYGVCQALRVASVATLTRKEQKPPKRRPYRRPAWRKLGVIRVGPPVRRQKLPRRSSL